MLKIYGDILSGNCYKIKLLTSFLSLEHEWIAVNILAGDTKSAEFLAKNPNGKIPLVELDHGEYLSESNAILNYFAEGTDYLPTGKYERAKVLQWQFFEQYSHEPYIAVARFINKYLGMPEERKGEYHKLQSGGHRALMVMETQLQKTPYLIGENLTIADISLYGYTHVAEEGGFDLSIYTGVQNWIERIQKHPKYLGMK